METHGKVQILSGPHYSTEYDAFWYRVRWVEGRGQRILFEDELDGLEQVE